MNRIAAITLGLAVSFAARADEGMWTYDNFPKQKVAQKYGFAPDDRWLEEARLSSVRLAGGCSGSFVSPDGLVMTNHHCAHTCIEQLSTKDKDFVKEGFYAKAQSEEVKCPEIELNQLVQISDVTSRVTSATSGLAGEQFAKAQKGAMAKIEKECAGGDAKVRCDVVTMYHGGRYDLYKYRRFQDVRLVFAPEFAIAFFGGDPDNFNFPRYDLDVSFLRAYEDDKPFHTDHYFKWSQAGAKEGDLTFVSGHPGGTDRDLTVSQLKFERDVALPDALVYLAQVRGFLTEYTRRGPEQHRTAEADLFYVENSYKAIKGRHEALVDPALFNQKEKNEQALQKKTKGNKTVAGAWDEIAKSVEKSKLLHNRLVTIEGTPTNAGTFVRPRGFGIGNVSDFRNARYLVRAAEELQKPNEERLREYVDSALPALKQKLFSSAPVYDDYETEVLRFSLTKLREVLGPDDPLVRKVFGKKSPDQLARELVSGSKLKDVAVRKQLFEGGKAAVQASNDPIIELARLVDPAAREIRDAYEHQVDSVEKRNQGKIAKARFQLEGTSNYPDATFTLRLSYGSVEGYQENGHHVNPITVMGGAFERATGSEPFALPKSWNVAKDDGRLNLGTPFDLATSNDIIGGNSGSPLFNQKLEVVGLIFDGNIQSLGGEYWFDPKENRAVSVASPALIEALDHIYGASRIVGEIRGGASSSGSK
ncbi:MAG: S46 family peptidase [Myxococcales bacterium]